MWTMAFICKCQGADPGTMESCNYRGTDRGVEQTPRSKTEIVTSPAGRWEITLISTCLPAWYHSSAAEYARVLVFRPFLLQINFHFSSISQPLKASSVSLIRLQLHLHLHTISSLFPVSKLRSLCFRSPLQIQAGSETMEMKILKWYKKEKTWQGRKQQGRGIWRHPCMWRQWFCKQVTSRDNLSK